MADHHGPTGSCGPAFNSSINRLASLPVSHHATLKRSVRLWALGHIRDIRLTYGWSYESTPWPLVTRSVWPFLGILRPPSRQSAGRQACPGSRETGTCS